MKPDPAGSVISQFLKENPDGPLYVATGTLSPYGLAWLAERTKDRPVIILTGEPSKSTGDSTKLIWMDYASERDKRISVDFLKRDHVWLYSEPLVHMKCYLANGIALIGSANLTRTGLEKGAEIIAEPKVKNLKDTYNRFDYSLKDATNQTTAAIELISGDQYPPSPLPPPPQLPSPRKSKRWILYILILLLLVATSISTTLVLTDDGDSNLGDCHPAYSSCLPIVEGDLINCPDLRREGYIGQRESVTVYNPEVDPYNLDSDDDADNIGCEPPLEPNR